MPLKSKAQQKWMFANKPEMAKEWADKTPNIKSLPNKVKKKTKSKSKKAFVSNLKKEIQAGKPKKQALAIAYSVKKK